MRRLHPALVLVAIFLATFSAMAWGRMVNTVEGVASAAGSCGPVQTTWTPLAAGGTADFSGSACGDVRVAAVTTGAACTVRLPTTPADGMTYTVKELGATNPAGILVVPGGSQSVELPSNAGTFGATGATVQIPPGTTGQVLTLEYWAANTEWVAK